MTADYDLKPIAELTVPLILDEITMLVQRTEYLPHEEAGRVVLHSGTEYVGTRVVDEPATIDHIGLHNDTRSIAFGSLAELRGWLRAARNP